MFCPLDGVEDAGDGPHRLREDPHRRMDTGFGFSVPNYLLVPILDLPAARNDQFLKYPFLSMENQLQMMFKI